MSKFTPTQSVRYILGRVCTPGICVLVALTAAGKSARAEDSSFCMRYAESAVFDYRLANSFPACGRPAGPRWHDNFRIHYQWCLQSTFQDTRNESDARHALLSTCTGDAYPTPNQDDAGCCPNSMLVCPAGRHFCR